MASFFRFTVKTTRTATVGAWQRKRAREKPSGDRATAHSGISISRVSEIRDDASIRVRREAVSIVTLRVGARAARAGSFRRGRALNSVIGSKDTSRH
jgi:hypothetical protein